MCIFNNFSAVSEEEADKLEIGDDIALYGEDGELYGTLKLEEKRNTPH
jgi:sulfate adenylyltransferase